MLKKIHSLELKFVKNKVMMRGPLTVISVMLKPLKVCPVNVTLFRF